MNNRHHGLQLSAGEDGRNDVSHLLPLVAGHDRQHVDKVLVGLGVGNDVSTIDKVVKVFDQHVPDQLHVLHNDRPLSHGTVRADDLLVRKVRVDLVGQLEKSDLSKKQLP